MYTKDRKDVRHISSLDSMHYRHLIYLIFYGGE